MVHGKTMFALSQALTVVTTVLAAVAAALKIYEFVEARLFKKI
jgi:hypothetical protein